MTWNDYLKYTGNWKVPDFSSIDLHLTSKPPFFPKQTFTNDEQRIPFRTNASPIIYEDQNQLKFKDKNWRRGIIWNDDWYARDENGLPILNYTDGVQHPYARGANDPNSGSLSRPNSRYTSDKNGIDITNRPWYRFNLSTYFDDDGNLTENGKGWFRQYRENSKSTNPKSFLKYIEQFIDSDFSTWTPITVEGTTYHDPKSFVEHYTTDRKIAEAYNTNTGTFNYFINDNGEIEGIDDLESGWESYNGNEDYTTYSLNSNYPTVNFKRWKCSNNLGNTISPGLGNTTSLENPSKMDTRLQQIGSIMDPKKQREVEETNPNGNNNRRIRGPFNPIILDAMRLAADNLFNIRNTNKYKEALRPTLENYSPSYRQVHGDYIAKQQAENAAASLRNRTPLTSNAQIQTASDLEAIAKGNQYIQQGQAKDAQTYWQTSEQAFQQSKENTLGWQNTANRNYTSLVNYNNKLAEFDYLANKDNMQNIDRFIAKQSKRLQEKYDLYEYKKMLAEEENNSLYDKYYGTAGDYELNKELTNKLDEILIKAQNETDKDRKATYVSQATALRRQLDQLANKVAAQRYINRLRRYNPEKWSNTFNTLYGNKYTIGSDSIINGFNPDYEKRLSDQQIDVDALKQLLGWKKNGGKFQNGGSFGVSYTLDDGEGNPYLQALLKGSASSKRKADYSSSDSSSSKDSDDDKQKDKLLNEIANTLKGIDGLNSDVDVLYQELSRFFDLQQYNLDDDPMQFYSMYIKALNRVNQVKQSAKQFDSAYKAMEKSGSITSPAIDSNGYVYIGIAGTNQIDKISPIEYLQNKDKYHLLRNNELLELRRNNSNYAFSDNDITEIAYNGTSMQEINKFIKDVLGKIGTDEESRDMIVRQFGQNAIEGLQQLQNLVQNEFTSAETAQIIANLKGTLTELNLTTKDQVEQAKLGIKTIIAMMPANMRTLLMIQGGDINSVEKIVTSYVFSGIDNYINFNFKDVTELDENGNLTGSSKSGNKSKNKSDGESKEPQKDQTLVSIVRGIGGTPGRITLNEGSKSEMSIDSTDYMIEGGYDVGKLNTVLKDTKIMGISDSRKIYFGDQLVDSRYLSNIAYLGRGFSRVMLPVTLDGSPDFKILSKFENVCNIARSKGIDPIKALSEDSPNDIKQKFANILKNEGLYGLVTNTGLPNISKFKVFLLTDGLASSEAGIKDSNYVVQNDDQSDLLGQILERDVDKFSAYNIADWFSYEKVYEGTIYIPININELQADIASGNKIKDSDAQQEESEAQSLTIRSRFKDRE